jgi:branched-chain amino acid transport system substrate-binding protein
MRTPGLPRRRWPRVRWFRAVAALSAAVLLAGCAASANSASSGSSTSKSPIVLAGLCAYTGSTPSPESCQISQAYFKYLNAHGGINGHPVEYTPLDDAGSSATAQQDGARAVEQMNVDALVGDYTDYGCTVNAGLLAQYKVYDMSGPEADANCWKSPYIFPINEGPWVEYASDIYYLWNAHHDQVICLLDDPAFPSDVPDSQNTISIMEQITGDHSMYLIPWTTGTPIAPVASAVVARGCQGFISAGLESDMETLQRALYNLGATKNITMLEGVLYASMAQQEGAAGQGELVASNDQPYWYDNTSELKLFHQLVNSIHEAPDSFSEEGFLSDLIFVAAVSKIGNGTYNRTTIGAALANMKNISGYGLQTPTTNWRDFNDSTLVFEINNGQWTIPVSTWYYLKATPAQVEAIATNTSLKAS